ncbi:MAG: hypothetical protein Greene041619_982 [Candidatus Peregrinibacteria bacterium Greene0416_19]|nr:MAG: hypothetical protein Greene041619_982 [Candidatus Peregrinibacteria bacterium Greene0416_19]
MQESPIEWLKIPGYSPRSWNNARGCKEVGTECMHCYAKTMAERWRGTEGHPYEFGFDFRIAPFKMEDPLRVMERCAVFVNSMTDVFYGGNKHDIGENPTDYIRDSCRVMLIADWHIYIILTKRVERMRKLLNRTDEVFTAAAQAPHIFWGVSAGNKKDGLPRIKILQDTDVRTRCVSFEPLLEDLGELDLRGIHWGKVGGESGAGFRPMQPQWAENVMRQLREQKVARHFKQWGGHNHSEGGRKYRGRTYDEYPAVIEELRDRKAPPRRDRLELIAHLRAEVREKWMNHPLLANVPDSMRPIYLGEEAGKNGRAGAFALPMAEKEEE